MKIDQYDINVDVYGPLSLQDFTIACLRDNLFAEHEEVSRMTLISEVHKLVSHEFNVIQSTIKSSTT